MWLMTMFDLPTISKEEKKEYIRFRKYLLREGFIQLQYSVYAKFLASRENSRKYYRYIQEIVPEDCADSFPVHRGQGFCRWHRQQRSDRHGAQQCRSWRNFHYGRMVRFHPQRHGRSWNNALFDNSNTNYRCDRK